MLIVFELLLPHLLMGVLTQLALTIKLTTSAVACALFLLLSADRQHLFGPVPVHPSHL
jgi:hypothetical protein